MFVLGTKALRIITTKGEHKLSKESFQLWCQPKYAPMPIITGHLSLTKKQPNVASLKLTKCVRTKIQT